MPTPDAHPYPMTLREYDLVLASRRSELTATISEIGASLRQLKVDGVDIVQPYQKGPPPLAAGVIMLPWPNRIEGGRWLLNGVEQQLEITDPASDSAIHGLLTGTPHQIINRGPDAVTLGADIDQPAGYPFQIRTAVRYRLVEEGLRIEHTVVNSGTSPAPVAIGAHPYLRVGSTPVDELILTVPARRHIVLDDRSLPVRTEAVTGTPYDLRRGARVRDVPPHIAFSALESRDGLIRMSLSDDDRIVELWAEAAFSWAQIYRTTAFPGADGSAIAIEPMTAPANAFRSGIGLRWLDPGEHWSLNWGITSRP